MNEIAWRAEDDDVEALKAGLVELICAFKP
jgi:hypothetical protein